MAEGVERHREHGETTQAGTHQRCIGEEPAGWDLFRCRQHITAQGEAAECRATGSLRMGGVSGDGLGEDVGSGWLVGVVRLDA